MIWTEQSGYAHTRIMDVALFCFRAEKGHPRAVKKAWECSRHQSYLRI